MKGEWRALFACLGAWLGSLVFGFWSLFLVFGFVNLSNLL